MPDNEDLGLNLDDLSWQDLASCRDMPINWFYDDYEASEGFAKVIDEACLSCPVMKQCLEAGIENSEFGVWGCIYLNNGKPDTNRNAHKTKEVWKRIEKRIKND